MSLVELRERLQIQKVKQAELEVEIKPRKKVHFENDEQLQIQIEPLELVGKRMKCCSGRKKKLNEMQGIFN